ncbi:hypothetical protein LZQ00_15380 [Sphingobacterium sp. SRCM116780]|uniref:hypothetical protein n=1 Tax=Sphingobacterium sp. SRCM116780 TaxID=2907623 RepID=UPI001F45709C|nr:hypothetical protein [Sphingobacterium sp. SRCM116780]UIR55639.1 hypothetical protein LZQ00_15380 [Sphingobacterium sp. SRCM116780]
MKKLVLIPMCIFFIVLSCKKDKAPSEGTEVIKGDIKQVVETQNGITYKIFTDKNTTTFKGILVVGSGNDENNPSEGGINGAVETALCEKAAANGYAAAIVKYRKTPGTEDWNGSAKMLGEDYDKCIVAIAGKYNIDKNKSVVAGFSYSSFLLLTHIAYYDNLSYCKGLLAACGSTDQDKINKFKIPVLSLTGKDEFESYEGNFIGATLYTKIPANSPIKAKSEGFSDPNSTGHCNGDWTEKMFTKMNAWMQ